MGNHKISQKVGNFFNYSYLKILKLKKLEEKAFIIDHIFISIQKIVYSCLSTILKVRLNLVIWPIYNELSKNINRNSSEIIFWWYFFA